MTPKKRVTSRHYIALHCIESLLYVRFHCIWKYRFIILCVWKCTVSNVLALLRAVRFNIAWMHVPYAIKRVNKHYSIYTHIYILVRSTHSLLTRINTESESIHKIIVRPKYLHRHTIYCFDVWCCVGYYAKRLAHIIYIRPNYYFSRIKTFAELPFFFQAGTHPVEKMRTLIKLLAIFFATLLRFISIFFSKVDAFIRSSCWDFCRYADANGPVVFFWLEMQPLSSDHTLCSCAFLLAKENKTDWNSPKNYRRWFDRF